MSNIDAIKEKAQSVKERLAENFSDVKNKGVEFYSQSSDLLKERAKLVDDKVHNNPWPVVAGAFLGGVLLGYILGRK